MTTNISRVIIADDDFMIAKVHKKVVDAQEAFQVVGVSYNYEQTLSLVQTCKPDLLILDVYMPDGSGIDLLREMRAKMIPCDVILITAANELSVVEEAFRLGIFHYLIKPFNLEDLTKSLDKYVQFKSKLSSRPNLDQAVIDDLKKIRSSGWSNLEEEKGIDYRTLENIKQVLSCFHQVETVEKIAKAAGVSRSTARTYLNYLAEKNMVEVELKYGRVGRPQTLYRISSENGTRNSS